MLAVIEIIMKIVLFEHIRLLTNNKLIIKQDLDKEVTYAFEENYEYRSRHVYIHSPWLHKIVSKNANIAYFFPKDHKQTNDLEITIEDLYDFTRLCTNALVLASKKPCT